MHVLHTAALPLSTAMTTAMCLALLSACTYRVYRGEWRESLMHGCGVMLSQDSSRTLHAQVGLLCIHILSRNHKMLLNVGAYCMTEE